MDCRYGLLVRTAKLKTKKMAQRDTYQRRAYAMRRLSLATERLNRATSKDDRENACFWIEMWGAISGVRQFKLGNGGDISKKGK